MIVTPPALASQWADEFATHAPSLKVLVYEGWTKLQVPITQRQVEEERQRRMERRLKKLEKDKQKAKVKRKRKGKGISGSGSNTPQSVEHEMVIDVDDGSDLVDWCTHVQGFDVVITTYVVLQSDLNVAGVAPDRPRREAARYSNLERPRSPLVMCEWNRVVMDEVQMMGGGKSEFVDFSCPLD